MKTDTLTGKIPRETAGAVTQRAFDFQIHVSIARILELHAAGGAYIALFDHFDDLVLIEGEYPNQVISFYQVKSSVDTVWTVARLAKRASKGDLPRSIIGKAYYNIVQFGPLICRAAIISNQPLHADLATGEKVSPDDGEIVLSNLNKDEHKTLVEAIVLDFPGPLISEHTHILRFERVPFDLQSFRDTVLGRITSFVEKIGPDTAAIAKPFYDALLSEAGRCTGHKAKPADLAQLTMRKGIGRKDIDDLVSRAQQRGQTILEWWPSVQAELNAKGGLALTERRLRRQCLEYWRARERGTAAATKLSQNVRAAIITMTNLNLDGVLEAAAMLRTGGGLSEPDAEPYDLQSALIVELMEEFT